MGAAVAIEELHTMGCEKFIICGGAGALTKDSKVGEIIIPVPAVRDEGTFYHYLESSREVECHRETVKTVVSCLENKFKSEFEEEIMKAKRCVKESFVVIGKEGSTLDGEGFIQRLWANANSHFGEVLYVFPN